MPDDTSEAPDIGSPADSLSDAAAPSHRHGTGPSEHPAADLVRDSLLRLVEAGEGPFRPVQGGEGLPHVLVDREQIVDALGRLVSSAALRAGDAYRLRIRLGLVSATAERGTREEPFVRIDILFSMEAITDDDLGPTGDSEHRRQHRRLDVATGEQLVVANGGRLVYSPEDRSEKGLAVLLPVCPTR